MYNSNFFSSAHIWQGHELFPLVCVCYGPPYKIHTVFFPNEKPEGRL